MARARDSDAQSRKIAAALEKVVDDGIVHIEVSMTVLKLPPSLRGPMWQSVIKIAMAKVIECEGKADG